MFWLKKKPSVCFSICSMTGIAKNDWETGQVAVMQQRIQRISASIIRRPYPVQSIPGIRLWAGRR